MHYRFFILSLIALILLTANVTIMAAQDDIEEHRECAYCGMDRKAYGYSRMLVVYEDGVESGVCSLHCALVEIDANRERPIRTLLVADRDTRSLIDADKAVWVMGGKKRGVMTERPKWAFSTEAAARAFTERYGGTIVTLEEAMRVTREEIAESQDQSESH